MDTRVLYAVSIVIASIAGGYYYYSGSAEKLQTDDQNMTYSAKGIVLTQTDELGQLYLRATVQEIQQNVKTKNTAMQDLNAVMYKQGKPNATFSAARGQGLNDNNLVVLSGDVIATQQSSQGQMTFKTRELRGYPKTRMLESRDVVTVTYPKAEFVSQGLKADLNSGQYEFFNIRGKYAPKS